MTDSDPKDDETIKAPLSELPDIEQVYANGFQVALGNADVIVTLQRNGKQIQNINMSFTLAKTLSQMLGNLIDSIETEGDFKIKTTKELDKTLTGISK